MVGLLTPSGIASDKTAARFFKGVATGGRLRALYDFENKKVFFPDVHASFKFCVFVASPSPVEDSARCAFYLHSVAELDAPERCFPLTAEDFSRGPRASCASRAKRSSAPEPECSPRQSSTLPPPVNNPNWAKIYDYYDVSGIIDKIDDYLFDKLLLLIGEDGANLINRSTPIAFMEQGKY